MTSSPTSLIKLPLEILVLLSDTYLKYSGTKTLYLSCKYLNAVFTPYMFRDLVGSSKLVPFPKQYTGCVRQLVADYDDIPETVSLLLEYQPRRLKTIDLKASTNCEYLWNEIFQFSSLEVLIFQDVSNQEMMLRLLDWSKSMAQPLQPFWPKLKNLFVISQCIKTEDVGFLILNAPKIECLKIEYLRGNFNSSTIQHYPSTLTEIDFAHSQENGFTGSEFFRILNSCPALCKLEFLRLVDDDHFTTPTTTLSFPAMKEFFATVTHGAANCVLDRWRDLFPNLESLYLHTIGEHNELRLHEKIGWPSVTELYLQAMLGPALIDIAITFPNVKRLNALFLEDDWDDEIMNAPDVGQYFTKLERFTVSNINQMWMEWFTLIMRLRGPDCPKLVAIHIDNFEDLVDYTGDELLRLLDVVANDLKCIKLTAPVDLNPELLLLRYTWAGLLQEFSHVDPFQIDPHPGVSPEVAARWDEAVTTIRGMRKEEGEMRKEEGEMRKEEGEMEMRKEREKMLCSFI